MTPTRTSGSGDSLVRVRLEIAYDGTDFRGLAPNPGVRTVVGELTQVLGRFLQFEPNLVMSGRTDAGVHSIGQVLSFDAPERTVRQSDKHGSISAGGALVQVSGASTRRLIRTINAQLAPEIVALKAEIVEDNFSARFDAVGRSYVYRVLNREFADPLKARFVWHVPESLDLASMRLACDPILGEHDFSSFCRRPKAKEAETPVSLSRRVNSASWHKTEAGMLEFHISGSAFCHQMVRSLVGFHIAVGRGKRSAGEVLSVLAARDRQVAEQPAPPQGLVLVSVQYPSD